MKVPGFIQNLFTRNYAIADQWVAKMGAPIYTNWTIQKAVAEGYKVNGWVYRSVYLIAKAISQVEWGVTNQDGEHLPEHHLSKLLKNPNPNISRQDIFELVTSWLELAGNSYLKKVIAGGKTIELWPVSPDRLFPVPAKQIDEWLAGYCLDQKLKELIDPVEIIHHKFFNPANPLLGIAPLQAAARTVDVDNSQQDWNKAAMQNRGVVDGLMSFDRTFESQDAVDKISDRLNESSAGAKNARKIKVVGSNAKYTRMSLNPVEMDFSASGDSNRDKIFIVFGIPPVYGGSQSASTYNNFAVSELVFWFQTAIPLLDDLKDTFNLSFKGELKDSETLSYDLSKVPAIKKAMTEWTKTAQTLHDMGVPFKQLNQVFNFGFDEFEDWEKSYVKSAKPAVTEQRKSKYRFKNPASETKYTLIETRAAFDEKKEIAKLAEGPIKDVIFNLLDKQKDAVFRDLDKAESIIKKSIPDWVEEFNKIYMDVGVEFGSKLVVEKRTIESEIELKMADYMEAEEVILIECSEIAKTTTDKILLQVADAVEKGYAINEIQQAIQDTGIFSPGRALLIARTEVGTAANLGQLTSAGISGATHKTWSTATFEVRDSHQAMNGVKVKIDEAYNVGGESAMYPMDHNLSPANKCNCRCNQTFSIE